MARKLAESDTVVGMNKQAHGHTLMAPEELRTSFAVEAVDVFDPFVDEEPLECSIDHVEICESCQ